jgi:hypothetical protein
MKTVVIQIDNNSNYRKIIDAIRQFKGVQHAELATEEQLENLSILKACKVARETELVTEAEIMGALK